MTTLAEDITATQTLIPVDAGLVNGTFSYPLYYTIDSEAIVVTGKAIDTTWSIERGVAGTTPATHAEGATMTRYYPDAKPTGGDSALPDPAEAPDGQVPTTAAGAYELASPTFGPIQIVARTLTSAEIQAIASTPVELLPALPGKLYAVLSVDYVYHFGTVPYVVDGGQLFIGTPLGLDFLSFASHVGWLDQSEDQYGWSDRGVSAAVAALMVFENKPITIRADGSPAAVDPTDGDGTLDLTVLYREVDVS